MILEVAVMRTKPDRIAEFESVFPRAAAISASTPGYVSHEENK
jgi:heme-degrading monooxygenase HmoA